MAHNHWTVTPHDILLKTSEMIDPDNWCAMRYFEDDAEASPIELLAEHPSVTLDEALLSRRCLEGQMAVSTALLGGTHLDFDNASEHFHRYLLSTGHQCRSAIHHNDLCVLRAILVAINEDAQRAVILDLKEDVRKAGEWHK